MSINAAVSGLPLLRYRRIATRAGRVLRVIGLVAVANSCSSSTSPKSSSNGTLAIVVKPTSGATPFVVVTGPAGDTAVVTRVDTTLSVPPGTYTVASASAVIVGPVATQFFTGTAKGSPAHVATGATATIEITFALRPGSNHLWVVGGPAGHAVAAAYTKGGLDSAVA